MKFKKYFREKHKKPRTICLPINYSFNRCVSRFFDSLAHPNLSAILATDQKLSLSHLRYILPKFSSVPLTIVLIPIISTILNGTLLHFGKRYDSF